MVFAFAVLISVAVAPADQRVDGLFDLLLVRILIQAAPEKLLDFLPLVRIVLKGILPVFLGDPLLIQSLLGSGKAIAL